jgi:hypothetical protein
MGKTLFIQSELLDGGIPKRSEGHKKGEEKVHQQPFRNHLAELRTTPQPEREDTRQSKERILPKYNVKCGIKTLKYLKDRTIGKVTLL